MLVDLVLGEIFIGLSFVLAILVFVYCLGPDINIVLTNYTQALEGNLEEDIAVIESSLNLKSEENQYNEDTNHFCDSDQGS